MNNELEAKNIEIARMAAGTDAIHLHSAAEGEPTVSQGEYETALHFSSQLKTELTQAPATTAAQLRSKGDALQA